MKNTKFSKILVLVLTLALVIGAAFGIGTMAEGEEPAVEIVAQNVSYGGSISIMYAVKSTGLADGQYVVIEGSAFNPVDETIEAFTVSDFETTDYNVVVGEEDFGKLPVYYTPGIPLKNMATTVTAKAVVYNADNTKAAESASLSYSVLEYLYERQFMFDSVNTAEQKKLYSLMLETGDTVQKVLENYGAGFAPSDYAYVSITGGTFDGKTSGIVKKGTEITLTGNDGGFMVTPVSVGEDYAIVEGDAMVVANNGTYTVDGSVIIGNLRGYIAGSGEYLNMDLFAGTKYNYSSGSAPTVNKNNSSNVVTATVADGILSVVNETVLAESYLRINNSKAVGATAVLEFEIKLSEMPEGTAWRLFEYNVGGLGGEFYLVVKDGKFAPATKSGTAESGFTYPVIEALPTFSANTWYNFCVEVDTTTAQPSNITAKYTINGIVYDNVKIVNTVTRSAFNGSRMDFYIPAVDNARIDLDNVVMGSPIMAVSSVDYNRGQGTLYAGASSDKFSCDTVTSSYTSLDNWNNDTRGTFAPTNAVNIVDGAFLFDNDTLAQRWIGWYPTATATDKVAFEIDIKFDSVASTGTNNFFQFDTNVSGVKSARVYYKNVGDLVEISGSGTSVYLQKGLWHNIRMEIDLQNQTSTLWVNGNAVSGFKAHFVDQSSRARFFIYADVGECVTYDNVYASYVQAE